MASMQSKLFYFDLSSILASPDFNDGKMACSGFRAAPSFGLSEGERGGGG